MEFELSEEHNLIRETARRIAEAELLPRAAQTDKEGLFPREQMKLLAENGFLDVGARRIRRNKCWFR